MTFRPDRATLDAMLLGGAEDDPEAWEWLTSAPEAEAEWARALHARRRTDRLALAIQGRPWLAKLTLAALRRRTRHVPLLECFMTAPSLEARLREGAPATQVGLVAWGQVSISPLRLGHTVALRTAEPGADVRFFYRSREAEGELPGAGWTLEPGEAPVLLLACLDTRDASTVNRAIMTATAVAGVVVVELENGETDT